MQYNKRLMSKLRFQVFHCVHFECPAQVDDKFTKASTREQSSASSDNILSPDNILPPPPPEVATEAVHIDSDDS